MRKGMRTSCVFVHVCLRNFCVCVLGAANNKNKKKRGEGLDVNEKKNMNRFWTKQKENLENLKQSFIVAGHHHHYSLSLNRLDIIVSSSSHLSGRFPISLFTVPFTQNEPMWRTKDFHLKSFLFQFLYY